MSVASRLRVGLIPIFVSGCIGCNYAPGRPAPGPEVPRPDQVMDFSTLYKQNCAGCHGENGKTGVAIPMANPVYLALVGEANLRRIVAKGVTGKLMPAFDESAGGALTERQVDSLVDGIFRTWSRPDILAAVRAPPYAVAAQSDPVRGQKAFGEFCAPCHGADGNGVKSGAANNPAAVSGSIVDPSYLDLVTDQGLRSTIIAGRPDQGMPDWRSDEPRPGSHAMSDQEVTDIVAWLAAQRAVNPGQPYASRR